jgi:hypothetical protein
MGRRPRKVAQAQATHAGKAKPLPNAKTPRVIALGVFRFPATFPGKAAIKETDFATRTFFCDSHVARLPQKI